MIVKYRRWLWITGILLGLWCSPVRADDWDIYLTADNVFDVYFGSTTSTDSYSGGGNNWTTTYHYTATGVDPADYVYVVAASDWDTSQGLIGVFTDTTTGSSFVTQPVAWEVFPAGAYAATNPNFPGPWPANTLPTQAEVDAAIAYAEVNNLWVGVADVSGFTNGVEPWGFRPNIPSNASWIWHNSGNGPDPSNPLVGGYNHDEFLVFRAILPTLTVTSPNGGEVWQAGTTQLITWDAIHPVGDVYIELWKNGSPDSYVGTAPMNFGAYSWDICEFIGDDTTYNIRVYSYDAGPLVQDTSDADFEITGSLPIPTLDVTYPDGGEILYANQTYEVTWDSTNAIGDVSVELYKGGSGSLSLGYVPMSDGSLDFTVCEFLDPGTDYTIRLSFYGCDGTLVESYSASTFEIAGTRPRPTLSLVQPDGGGVYPVGSTMTIEWESTNPAGDVYISLEKAGQGYSYIASVPMEQGSFDWEVCNPIGNGTDYRVYISWYACGFSVEDRSSSDFEINGSDPRPTFTVTSPNGGDVLTAGMDATLTWDSTNPIGNVYAWLLKGDPYYSYYQSLGSAPMANGSMTVPICASIGDGTDYRIYLSWGDCGPSISDISDNLFEITGSQPRPTIEVTSPNGGEVWAAGTTQTITWLATDPSSTVTISLYKGLQYVTTLATVPMSDQSYTWNLCSSLEPGDDYVVQLRWYECGPEIVDSSNTNFEITNASPPTLTVTSPNGGETWATGSTHSVTWSTSLTSDYVNLSLYKAGVYVTSIAYVPASTASYEWQVCSLLGDGEDFAIRASIYTCAGSLEDESDSPFSITGSSAPPSLTVTSPNGGESWIAGTTHVITWSSTGFSGSSSLQIEVLKGGSTYQYLTSGVPVSAGTYNWTVCNYLPDGSDYRVRLTAYGSGCGGGTISDQSDGNFTITGSSPLPTMTLTSPNGGEMLTAGTAQTVTWDSTNPTGTVSISYFRTSIPFSTYGIGSAPMSAGSFTWNICSRLMTASDYKLRITWSPNCGSSSVQDESDSTFSIAGTASPLTLISPNGGEMFTAGSTHSITWTGGDPNGTAQIYLYKGMSSYQAITLGAISLSSGHFDWHICEGIGDGADYWIVMQGYDCAGSYYEYSDAMFTITGSTPPPTLTVTSPNGGESFAVGTTQAITWSATNPSGTVGIYLLIGSSPVILGTAPTSAGHFDWHICDALPTGGNYGIYLVLTNCGPSTYDLSDAPFTIMGPSSFPTVTITSPNGDVLTAGTTHTVTWTTSAPISGPALLYLLKGSATHAMIGVTDYADGHFDWQICDSIGDGSDYRVVLYGYVCRTLTLSGTGNQFTIMGSSALPATPTLTVTGPANGSVLPAGQVSPITWDSTNASGDVVGIAFRTGPGGQSFEPIGTTAMSSNELDWQTPSCDDPFLSDAFQLQLYYGSCGHGLLVAPVGVVTVQSSGGAGDIDNDCDVDLTDLDLFVNVLLGVDTDSAHVEASDLNHDGFARGDDISEFMAVMFAP